MTKEELKEALGLLRSNYVDMEMDICRQYIKANNPYKKGDTIADPVGSIIIDSIHTSISGLTSCAAYKGLILNKDGIPNKKGNVRVVYQKNIL